MTGLIVLAIVFWGDYLNILSIGFIVFAAIGLLCLIDNIYVLIRNKIIKTNGVKGTGKVLSVKHSLKTEYGDIDHKLTFTFKDEQGNERQGKGSFYHPDGAKVEALKHIPLIIYKTKAIIDEEALFGKQSQFFTVSREKGINPMKTNIVCSCGQVIKEGLFYCPKCGLPVSDTNATFEENATICPNCGEAVADKHFCSKCGYKLK